MKSSTKGKKTGVNEGVKSGGKGIKFEYIVSFKNGITVNKLSSQEGIKEESAEA